MEVTLVFPHQLFSSSKALAKDRTVLLCEHSLFFTQYAFHKKKLILHRASMKSYQSMLEERGYSVEYLEISEMKKKNALAKFVEKEKIKKIHYCDVVDDWLSRELQELDQKCELETYPSPNFLTSNELIEEHLGDRKNLRMSSFYIEQRRRLNVLLDGDGPEGGKWSYDADNRKKLPKDISIPKLYTPNEDSQLQDAVSYIEKNFKENPGESDGFEYPFDSDRAKRSLSSFLENKLENYGDYQDAIDTEDSFLFHSVLSSSINAGLLQPDQVIEEVLNYSEENEVPLNCLEGFVRQVIGWREYVRGVYVQHGRVQRTRNFFDHKRSIPASFWSGSTGIDPIDIIIKRILKTGYANHIERLMIFSNFFLLCEFDPDEVFEWFSALFIDAYDWVMVPNVYGMGLYADGGMMITKPYVSSSNYVLKMSRFKKGDWCEVWDALYWRFMHIHKDLFAKNPRTRMTLSHLDRMGQEKLNAHLETAETFLKKL